MPRTPVQILRGLLTFVALTAVAIAVGLGIGLGIGEVSSDDSSDSGLRSSKAGAVRGTDDVAPTPPDRTFELAGGVRLGILRATFTPATTASGRKRKRGRVAVQVRLRNEGGTLVDAFPAGPTARLRLVVRRERVAADRKAIEPAKSIARSLAPESIASGELRFETVGSTTTRLEDADEVRLRIGERTVTVPLT